MTQTKRCAKCGEQRPLHDFNAATHSPDGLQYYCKGCKARIQRDKRLATTAGYAQRLAEVAGKHAGKPAPQPMDDEATEPGAYATGAPMADGAWASIPDVHDPFHDRYAWAVALEVVRRHKPKLLHIAGDLMDCSALSVHEPTSLGGGPSFDDELASANRRLDELAQAIPGDCKVVFTEGNHEFRWVRELAKFKQHTSIVGNTMPELLKFPERAWKWVPFREHYNVPGTNLRLTHGLERYGVNSVRQALADIGDGSIIVGDVHTRQVHEVGDADGRYRFSACFGWLGSHDAITYRHRTRAMREWRHGLGVGWMIDGRAYPLSVPIVDRRAVFEGHLIRAA